MIISEFERITFGVDYRVLKGYISIDPISVHFPPSSSHLALAVPVYIKNTFTIEAKLEGVFASDPRFKIINRAKTISPGSIVHAFDISFDRFFKTVNQSLIRFTIRNKECTLVFILLQFLRMETKKENGTKSNLSVKKKSSVGRIPKR